MNKIDCFLPCRSGSERVPLKNVRRIASYEGGLVELKLKQLILVESIANIILSTDDEDVIKIAKNLNNPKIKVIKRHPKLATSTTSTDDLIRHAAEVCTSNHIMWTHVTSPFFDENDYRVAIQSYREGLNQGFDSLMAVTELRGFIWDDAGPINYDRNMEKWPRTQTIVPLYEINSALFISSIKAYKAGDRIGVNPLKYVANGMKGWDIDWPDDFVIAEQYLKAKSFD